MKLIFPNGEHNPVELTDGRVVLGSGADCEIRFSAPGIAIEQAELRTKGDQTMVRSLAPEAATVLNGKQIVGEMPIRPGDLLLFAKVGCRVVAMERGKPPLLPVSKSQDNDNDGRTKVRMALPKYLLRGVSGPTFGKVYAMVGAMSVGRNSECDVCIPIDEISRQHAKLQVVPDGVMVEDLGSANGTFINNQRVHGSALLKDGDELRMDTVRFLLMSPGMQVQPSSAAVTARTAAVKVPTSSNTIWWIISAVVVLAVAAVGVLFYLGKI